ncbi:MAG: EamA family transporter [Firmicutes bacterium]|nr:EamA family transporter [Bacillota bacterium]
MTIQKPSVESTAGIRKNPAYGYGLALSAAVIWGSLGILAKLIYNYGVEPIILISLRSPLAFIALFISLAIVSPSKIYIKPKHIPFFTVFGFIGIALNHLTYFESLRYTSPTTASIILYTAPAFVVLGAAIFYKEPLTKAKITALIITFIGCFLVVGGYDRRVVALNPTGITLGIISAITYASYTLLSKYALSKYSPLTTVLYAFGFGGIFLICFAGKRLVQIQTLPFQAWILILCLALGPTIASYVLYVLSLNYIDAAEAGIICMAEPATTALLSFILFRETPVGLQWAGAALVLVGILIIQTQRLPTRSITRIRKTT